jgi:phage tail sheath protein FI
VPIEPTYPGVYIEETPGGVRAIEGVPTSITAFIGGALRGPVNEATTVVGFGEFEQRFGGLWAGSMLGFAVRDFFLNGGGQAVIVRLHHPDAGTCSATSEGLPLALEDFLPPGGEKQASGLYALEQVDLFNLLCIPPYRDAADDIDIDPELVSAAASYCEKRRAMLIVDAPKAWTSAQSARDSFIATGEDPVGTRSRNAALYFPRLCQANPLRAGQLDTFAACGAVAGVFARNDANRGVWKAPAGLDAHLIGAAQLSVALTDADVGELNPLGVNCLRSLPVSGPVVWGARTLRGADRFADEYKYVPVRRLALFIEESLHRGLQWMACEPNDESSWAQVRLQVGTFLHGLFKQGAFQGSTPREAYFARCDSTTTTQDDIDLGVANIMVGFAPLKPAEFVVIRLQQMTRADP